MIMEFTVIKAFMFLCFFFFEMGNNLILSMVFPLRISSARKITISRGSLSKAVAIPLLSLEQKESVICGHSAPTPSIGLM